MTEANSTTRIKRIEVTGLFGLYDHVIDLNLEERVTILHGPNGVGKTILLKMVRAVLTKQYDDLAKIPFNRFKLDFTSGPSIDIVAKVTSEPTAASGGKHKRTTKTLMDAVMDQDFVGSFTQHITYPAPKIFEDAGLPGSLARQFPEIQWAPDPGNDYWNQSGKPPPVHLIEDQRILRRLEGSPHLIKSTSQLQPAVWGNAIGLKSLIDHLRKAYGDSSRELDQSFPTRLVQNKKKSLSAIELKTRMIALDDLRARLRKNGLVDEPQTAPFDVASLDGLTTAESDVMALVVGDNEKKLGIFAGLLGRVELFLRIVNGRFRNKALHADSHQGLVVVDQHGQPLELRALSSGEQQQIVLFYDLLFRTQRDSLVLLDEPELSWHVLWQERFLPDLLEIVQLVGIDVLLATHSPDIIGDRSDLTVALTSEIAHDELTKA